MKKHIAFLIMNFANIGGTERVTSIIADNLINRGYQISVISCRGGEKCSFPISSSVALHSLHGEKVKNPAVRKLLTYQRLKKLVKDIKVDIMVAVEVSLYLYLWPLQVKKLCKCVAWEHFNYFIFRNINTKIARNFAARYADCVIVLGKSDLENYKQHIKKINRIEYIYNPLAIKIDPISDTKAKNITAMGRLQEQKGFDLLIQSWAKIEWNFPEWKLNIFGEGSQRTALEQQIQSLNLKNIHLRGYTRNTSEALSGSSIFVLSSRYEGFGLVLIEAQAKGLPCVSFACKEGPSEIIDDNVNGFLVEPLDVDLLADKLKVLMSDEKLRGEFSKNSTKDLHRFDPEVVTDEWVKLIESLDRI